MKKTKYDLSIFELGLKTGAFYYADVLNLLYGSWRSEIVCAMSEFGYLGGKYNWSLTNFQDIPLVTRRKLLKILFQTFDGASDSSYLNGLREEFYYRIYCVLATILEDDMVFDVRDSKRKRYDMYHCCFEDLVTPMQVMREILMWHQVGLPVTEKEKKLLRGCVSKFLPDDDADVDANINQRIEKKKVKLQLKLRKLNQKINAHNSSLRRWYNQMPKLQETGNIEEYKAVKAKYDHVCDEVMDPLYLAQQNCEYQLALAEAFPIYTGGFPSLEMLLAQDVISEEEN